MSMRLPTGLQVITRAEWGARYGDGYDRAPVPATDVWFHHSATIAPDLVPPFTDDDAAVRTLERIGQERFAAGISYTFAITPVGRTYQGHSIGRAGAHTLGHNYSGRAIVLVGNYDRMPPTAAQIDAAAQLLASGKLLGWWTRPALSGGHRDAERPGYTECPGAAAEHAIPEINARAGLYLARPDRTVPNPQPEDEGHPQPEPEVPAVILVGASGKALVSFDPSTGVTVPFATPAEAGAVRKVLGAADVPAPSVTLTPDEYDSFREFGERARLAYADDPTDNGKP